MKNLCLQFSLYLFILSFPSKLFAQDSKYDAVYLSVIKEYTLNPDGSMDYRYAKEQKLQSYRSFHNLYGETFIVYNPLYQNLKINESYTLMANGKKVTTPVNAFNEVLPGFAANAPAFNAIREMVITHTGLERNATIYLDYTIHSNKGSFPALGGNELLAEAEPLKNLIIRIRIPAEVDLFFKVFNADFPPAITKEGSFKVFTWQLKDLSAYSPEDHQPGDRARYPRLIFSTKNNYSNVLSFLTNQPAFQSKPTEPMKSAVVKWIDEIKDPLEIALKIQEKVVNDFRLIAVPLRYTGYSCRTPDQVWNSNYGNSLEKTLLLTTLLNSANIDAKPSFIANKDQYDDKVATLSCIMDFGVKIKLKEVGTIWLSATSLNPVSLENAHPGQILITPEQPSKYSFETSNNKGGNAHLLATFIVSSDPILTGEISISLRGTTYPWLDVLRDKNKIKNGIHGSISGKALTGIKESNITRDALFQTFSVKTDKPFRKDTGFFYFTLPEIGSGIDSWNIKTLSIKRVMPYEIPSEIEEAHQLTFTLPVGITLFTPVQKNEISNKAGSCLFEIKYNEGKMVLKRQIKIVKRDFTPETYMDLKLLLDHWNNPRHRELIFKSVQN